MPDAAREDRRDDPLDPMTRRSAQWGAPVGAPPLAAPAPEAGPRAPSEVNERVRASSLEDLLPQLVKRIAWSHERGRGTVRMEVGAGALAGAVLTVHADHGAVRVHLDSGGRGDLGAWCERIRERLRARGLDVGEIEIS